MLQENFIGMLRGETKRWSARRIVSYLIRRFFLYSFTLGGALIFAAPLLLMIGTSLKSMDVLYIRPFQWFPEELHFENYVQAWTAFPFTRYLFNTLYITIMSMTGAILSTSFAAYAFSRLKFPARKIFFALVIASMMLPKEAVFIPTYIIWWKLGAVGTYIPLIAPGWLARGLSKIFLLRQFFRTIPVELEDSAKIDGSSAFQRYFRIILPLAKPAIGVVMIFEFIGNWNSFVGPLIYLSDPKKYTLNVGLSMFRDAYAEQFQSMPQMHWFMAIATIIILPIIIIFVFLQKYFVEGIQLSGIKR
jgi:ABC-type glycerol-3-phosphate transport system permease component